MKKMHIFNFKEGLYQGVKLVEAFSSILVKEKTYYKGELHMDFTNKVVLITGAGAGIG
ncbi:hypothetical protein [Psychrobacillus antarcticus]|uniref:hypothetical protein n=1 Tax=Psychrobacillus antarcticus TaxID=2879115 RepID=UPI002407F899|nr:hypothetical protein [Psychrobacillus antarcticus]